MNIDGDKDNFSTSVSERFPYRKALVHSSFRMLLGVDQMNLDKGISFGRFFQSFPNSHMLKVSEVSKNIFGNPKRYFRPQNIIKSGNFFLPHQIKHQAPIIF